MKTFLLVSALAMAAILSGCADTPVSAVTTASRTPRSHSSSEQGGGIDSVTQAGIDETERQSQEDAQRMSNWITQQQNQQLQDQIQQMNIQASIDASNAAAAAADAANQQPIVQPSN